MLRSVATARAVENRAPKIRGRCLWSSASASCPSPIHGFANPAIGAPGMFVVGSSRRSNRPRQPGSLGQNQRPHDPRRSRSIPRANPLPRIRTPTGKENPPGLPEGLAKAPDCQRPPSSKTVSGRNAGCPQADDLLDGQRPAPGQRSGGFRGSGTRSRARPRSRPCRLHRRR